MSRPAKIMLPAANNSAEEPGKSEVDKTNIPVVEIIPKEQSELTKEEREIQRLRKRVYAITNDAIDYLHKVVQGEKGNRTRMRACESFIRFLPDLDKATGSQPLHLHLNVPRPEKKA